MKSLISFVMVCVICLSGFAIGAFAENSDVVNLNASQMSLGEMKAEIATASNKEKIIVISWEDGATAILRPVPESQIEPYLNTTKSLKLTTSSWSKVVTDKPMWPTTLEVTNKKGNPGAVDIKVKTDYAVNSEHYYYSLEENYYATFELGFPLEYTVYAMASDVAGKYSIKAND